MSEENESSWKNLLRVPVVLIEQFVYNLAGSLALGCFLHLKWDVELWLMWTLIFSVLFAASSVLGSIIMNYEPGG